MRIIILCFLVFTYNVCAQQDFNSFKTLRSEGKIPDDFSRLTVEKIQEDKGNTDRSLSKAQT